MPPRKNLPKAKTKRAKEAARMAVASGLSYNEAARLAGIAENEVMDTIRNVPDPVFQEMNQTMRRALMVKAYCVGMTALESLEGADFEAMSPYQRAQVAKIVIELGAEKLSAPEQEQSHASVTLEDVNAVMGRITRRVTELKIVSSGENTQAVRPPSAVGLSRGDEGSSE